MTTSDDFDAIVAGGLQCGLGWLTIFVLADEWVWVLRLVEVTKRVVDSSVSGLISPDVEDQVLHRTVLFWHLPVLEKYQY